MNGFDRALVLFVNHFARRWPAFDLFMFELSGSNLLKGGVELGVFWWMWFTPRPNVRAMRERLFATLAGGMLAVLAGRVLAHMLPFRVRPMHEAALAFVVPFGSNATQLRAWSSFPSDHAMLFASLSFGILIVSPRMGAFLLVWTAAMVGGPRLYLGMHYPTDLLGGAAIGLVIAAFTQWRPVREAIARPLFAWHDRHPASFYAAMYLLTLQVGTLFQDARTLVDLLGAALHLRQA